MYQKHFGLTQRPFSIAPDPRFLYMSQQHREALAHLLYGVGAGGGFVQLTGEVGTGKTTICRCLLEQLPEHVNLALIFNPRVTAQELLASLCDELRIPYARDCSSIKTLTDVLSAFLLDSHAQGQRTVLMIDEAQNLSADALEQVRLLTNLETTREKLLQIILVGQPELRALLAREELRQLSQRITARYHLQPIQREETAAYIRHRLQVCGAAEPVFGDEAIDLIQKLSAGVPRLINVLCDRSMLGAFVEDRHRVDAGIVRKAALEVLPEEGLNAGQGRTGLWLAVAAAGVAGAFALFLALVQPVSGPVVDRVADAAAPPAAALPQFTTAIPPLAVAAALQEPTVPAVAEGEPLDDIAGMAMENSVVEPVLPQAGLAAVVEDPLPAAPGLADVLAAASADAPSLAWAGLFRLWGIEAHVLSDEQACAQAPGVGLRCLQASGSWTALTHYDRPALLRLVGNEGRWIPVLVYELLGADVRIQVDGRDMVVPLDLLKQFWYGEYRLLWRTPPNGHAVLRPGDRDADVAWLRQRLQEATGLSSIAPDPAYFDPGLKQLVEEFQRSSDLNADGVAGPRTLINLNNLEKQPTVPRLGVSAAGAS